MNLSIIVLHFYTQVAGQEPKVTHLEQPLHLWFETIDVVWEGSGDD
jgi:hypothetical protein